MSIFADFSSDGLTVGFYPEDVYMPVVTGTKPPEEEGGQPTPIFGRNPNIPANVVEVTVDQYDEWLSNPGKRKWDGSKIVPYTPPPVVITYTSATKLGIKRALDEIGKWASFKTALAANADAQEEWDLAVDIKVSDSLTQAMIAVLNLSEDDVANIVRRANELV